VGLVVSVVNDAAPAFGVQVDRLGVVDRLGDPGGYIRDPAG
jgi:hypothetical protein